MSTWSKVLLEDANITVGTITPSLSDITASLTASNHGSVELVVLDSNELKTITADFNTGAFNPVTVDNNTMGSGFTVIATTAGTGTTITESDSLTLTAGTGISTTGTSDGVVTIANTITNNNQLTNGANYSTLVLGNSSSTALAGNTTILALGTSSSTALAGNTDVEVVSSANLLNGLALLDNGATIVIGDDADTTVKIAGNLQVTGTTETVSTTELRVEDITIAVASGSTTAAAANNAGLEVDIDTDSSYATNPAILFQSTPTSFSKFKMRKGVTGESDAFVAAMTTAATTGALDILTPGIGTFAMVGPALYIQTV